MSDLLALNVQQLKHVYPGGRVVLNQLSFQVADGERVGLLGANGAGKTTLFLRLCGVLPGVAGQVLVKGFDPANAADRRVLPKHIGIVFQNPDDQLVGSTVLEDVAFGPLNLGETPEEAQRLAEQALKQVGLEGAANQPPHRLSGGEKRRAAMAGVLAMQPEVLLLDEPSMFLDPRGRRELIQWLRQLSASLLIASHDLPLIEQLCSRVLVLHAGNLAYDGPTTELFANREKLLEFGLE
jgi:cobalt/nickel transport system ATP-binding protein